MLFVPPRDPETSEPETDDMRLRDMKGVKKDDYLLIDPRVLKVDPSYNVRDMESAETKEHIATLKRQIIANDGVHTPLEVRRQGNDIIVTAGHCRRVACQIGRAHV